MGKKSKYTGCLLLFKIIHIITTTSSTFLHTNYFIFFRMFKTLLFQTFIWSNRIHSLKCQRSTTSGCIDIGITKSKLVAKNNFVFFFNDCKARQFHNVIAKMLDLFSFYKINDFRHCSLWSDLWIYATGEKEGNCQNSSLFQIEKV